jgi:hypothetical protein
MFDIVWGVTSLPLGDSRQTCHQCQGSASKILNQGPSRTAALRRRLINMAKKELGKGFGLFGANSAGNFKYLRFEPLPKKLKFYGSWFKSSINAPV